MPTTSPASSSARQASMSRFSSNGSPTCTLGRLASSPSLKPAEASTLTPPMPSRPVDEPSSTARLPSPWAWPSTSRSVGSSAEAEHVDERVALVGRVEHDLAADGRHADGVAVVRDAAHDALGDPPAAGVVERTEPQRVHQGDRPRAHGEDVPQDAADAGGRALERLDGRRVVVALDADGGGDAVADIDDAGVLARTDEHPGRLGRQPAQVQARRLVGAVLGPHHRVHRQLEVVRCATQDRPRSRPPRRRSSRAHGAEARSRPPPYPSVADRPDHLAASSVFRAARPAS